MSYSRSERYHSRSGSYLRSRSRSLSPDMNWKRRRSLSRSRSRPRRYNYDAENPGNNLDLTGLSTRISKKEHERHFASEGGTVLKNEFLNFKEELEIVKSQVSKLTDLNEKLQRNQESNQDKTQEKGKAKAKGKQTKEATKTQKKPVLIKNQNLNNRFQRRTQNKPKPVQFIPPQIQTYPKTIQIQKEESQNHVAYTKNLKQITDFLNKNAREKCKEREGYTTIPLPGFNKLIAYPNTNPYLVKTAYSYGLLHVVYTNNGKELEQVPDICRVAKRYLDITKAELIFVRFYSAQAEITQDKILPPIQCVKIGLTKDMVDPDTQVQEEILLSEIREFFSKKRAKSIKIIFQELLQQFNNQKIWLYESKGYQIIFSLSQKTKEGSLEEIRRWLETLAKPEEVPKTRAIKQEFMSQESLKGFCRLMQKIPEHACTECSRAPELCDINLG